MSGRLRLLWVTPHLPRRGTSAARERWWHLLARIARRHDVTLVALVDPEDAAATDALPPGLAAARLVPKPPATAPDPDATLPRTVRFDYAAPALRAAIAAEVAAAPWDVVQYEYTELANLLAPPSRPAILTVHQLAFAAERAAWRTERGSIRDAALAALRWLRHLDFELRAVGRVHRVVTMSAEDAARLRRFLPALRVSVSPCGVDCETFRPPDAAAPLDTDVCFVGHFAHAPNVDAVRFLVRDVVPRVGRSVRVRIAGRGVTPDVAVLAAPGAVEVTGPVPDVRPVLARAAVIVAPVRFGTGMRGKVLDALAMARPVVTTPLGAEGLGAVPDRDLLVAADADGLARAIRRLLDDPALAARVGAAGRALAVARFDWNAIADAHDAIYDDVRQDPAPARPARDAAPPRGTLAAATRLALRAARWHAGFGAPRDVRRWKPDAAPMVLRSQP